MHNISLPPHNVKNEARNSKDYNYLVSKKKYVILGIGLWLLTIIFVAAPIWPYFYYRLSPQTSDILAAGLAATATESHLVANTPSLSPPSQGEKCGSLPCEGEGQGGVLTPTPSLPPFDPSLPTDNGLIIDKIKVRGQIHEGDDWQSLLKTGIWRVPNFGTPDNNQQPIILAAHRWGYLSWTNSFRTLNSFYNLPKLEVGDQVEIDWNQRKYIYEVYKSEIGDKISDYSANLILYTCELWNSPTRILKYAKRV